jgi:hypothetical protein
MVNEVAHEMNAIITFSRSITTHRKNKLRRSNRIDCSKFAFAAKFVDARLHLFLKLDTFFFS